MVSNKPTATSSAFGRLLSPSLPPIGVCIACCLASLRLCYSTIALIVRCSSLCINELALPCVQTERCC